MSKVEQKSDKILEILSDLHCGCELSIEECTHKEQVRQFVIQVQEAIIAIENLEGYYYEDEVGIDSSSEFIKKSDVLNKLKALVV